MNIAPKRRWIVPILASGCWAYSLATRFTDILFVGKLEKASILGSLLVVTSLLSAWLFWYIIPRVLDKVTQKKWRITLGISASLVCILFLMFYQLPPFPEQHQLKITASGDKNELSEDVKVQINAVRTLSLPDSTEKSIPITQFNYGGDWQGTKDGSGLLHEDGQPASISYERFMQAGIIVEFQTDAQSGIATVNWDNDESSVDLYSKQTGTYTLTLEPALNWHNADGTRKILVAGAVLADLTSTLIVILVITVISDQLFIKKKRNYHNIKLLLLCLALILLIQVPIRLINQPVSFSNPQLETVVRDALNQPEGIIYRNQLLTIIKLEASNKNINDITGIDRLSNLVELDLSGNQISDISTLSKLENLQKLNLRSNDISDLSPLANLTKLEYLNIHSNNSIHSISALKQLTNLNTLIMANIQIGEEASILERFNDLRYLNLRNCGIKDLEFIRAMRGLEYLNLYGNHEIQSIEPLEDLRFLDTLILTDVPIGDQIDILENLTMLSYLNLRNTDLIDISPLASLINLEYLNLHSNEKIQSIEPLENLTKVHTLILNNVPIGKQTDIFLNFHLLRNLDIRNCEVTDLSFLGELMAQGTLQDFGVAGITAAIDIRDNDITMEDHQDPYAAIRPYWENISIRQPSTLPFFSRISDPVFSQAAGFYNQTFQLEISNSTPGITIHYTLDSSEPTADSPVYTEPLLITSRAGKPNQYSAIETIAPDWNQPDEEVSKATIVRAIAIDDQTGETSAITTHTYFVGKDLSDQYALPIVSLVIDPDDLFDDERGIYVLGKDFTEASQSNHPGSDNQTIENYHRRGKDWERPVHLEILEKDSQIVFSQNAGVRIHGSSSRQRPQKSLRIYAGSEYDLLDTFSYPLFGWQSNNSDSNGIVNKTFLLRNSGQDWMVSMIRDTLAQELASDTNVDTQISRPVIVFLDGEYWGIYHLQERYDQYYLYNHYGIDTDETTILKNEQEIVEGTQESVDHYEALLNFISENDLSLAENYAYIQTQMDVDNYIDYLIANIYMSNTDWPHNNLYYWRTNTVAYTPDAPTGQDGRWRWMLFDLDMSFGFQAGGSSIEHDTLASAQADDWTGFLFRSLLENETFKNQFINRFADLMNTTYSTEHVLQSINQTQAQLHPEMDEFFERWNSSNDEALTQWEQEIEDMRVFAQERPDVIRQLLMEQFDLDGTATLTLNADTEKGYLLVNNTVVSPSESGSWKGVYFEGMPITITAFARSGYQFAGWEGSTQTESALTLEMDQNVTLTALFVEE